MWAMMPPYRSPRTFFSMPELTRELRYIGLLGAAFLLLMGLTLSSLENWAMAIQWTLLSALLWSLVWQQSAQRLIDNRSAPGTALYPSLGWANRLTILRGFLIALCAGFLWQSLNYALLFWLPAFLYSVAAILDRVDGYVARRTQRTSEMGNALDNVFDALGLLVAPLLALDFGKIHWAYLLVSCAYYAFHLGLRWRTRQGRPNYSLTPNQLRRTLAGFQMGYVAVVLWPPFDAQITRLAGFAFMLPILIGFMIDWCVVSGRIDMQQARTERFFNSLATRSVALGQPALRLVFLIALAFMITQGHWQGLTLLGYVSAAILISLGIGARLGALLALALLALLPPLGDSAATTLLLFSATWIMLLGSGRYSLWQGDDHWVERHDGEQ
jgi:CDP-diacylglycerol--glycerol-3-phosphate 3-phosphatidyltransferase